MNKLALGFVAIVREGIAVQRGEDHLAGHYVGNEFKTADGATIDDARLRFRTKFVLNVRLASRALPGHGARVYTDQSRLGAEINRFNRKARWDWPTEETRRKHGWPALYASPSTSPRRRIARNMLCPEWAMIPN